MQQEARMNNSSKDNGIVQYSASIVPNTALYKLLSINEVDYKKGMFYVAGGI